MNENRGEVHPENRGEEVQQNRGEEVHQNENRGEVDPDSEELDELLSTFHGSTVSRDAPLPKLSKREYFRKMHTFKINQSEQGVGPNLNLLEHPPDPSISNPPGPSISNPPDLSISNPPDPSISNSSDSIISRSSSNIARSDNLDFWILKFKLQNSLSWESTEILARAISLLSQSPVSLSKYKFKSWLNIDHFKSEIHICRHCLFRFESANTPKTCPQCSLEVHKDDYYLYFSIKSQINQIVNDEFLRKIKFHYQKESGSTSDICFSEFYKKIKNNLPGYDPLSTEFSSNYFLTFSINTDGVSAFKSSNRTLWPIFITFNELPLNERYLAENVILTGIYCSTSKPDFLQFFRPIVDELKNLENDGLILSNLSSTLCKFFTISLCADKPARSQWSNTTQYNGSYGCMYCYSPGERFEKRWVYSQFADKTLRTNDEYKDLIQLSDLPKYGIKDRCIFDELKFVDMFKSFPFDYMHGSLLGVAKNLTSRFFDKEFKNKQYSLFNQISNIENSLKSVSYPKYIPRSLSSIHDYKSWKANEFRTFYIFIAFPLISNYLSRENKEILLTFINILSIICSSTLSFSDIIKVEKLSEKFLEIVEKVFGKEFMTSNVHDMNHYGMFLRQFGSAYNYSLFPYEDLNRKLFSSMSGFRNIQKQLSYSFFLRGVIVRIIASFKIFN